MVRARTSPVVFDDVEHFIRSGASLFFSFFFLLQFSDILAGNQSFCFIFYFVVCSKARN